MNVFFKLKGCHDCLWRDFPECKAKSNENNCKDWEWRYE